MPERIQLRRTKGWRKPEGAIVVARPSKWGNLFKVHSLALPTDGRWPYLARAFGAGAEELTSLTPLHPQAVVDAYSWWIIEQPDLMCSLDELRGHDLACWCPLEDGHGDRVPCHADVLLELANQEATA